ncbi:ORF3 [Caenorhabditis elegans]|uniref:ORF3 n=1 Tax=Caenorhabditis elegans TaxID=6239 RepID=Q564Y9_CAEEL|nr:ORF3 [Caenorhabditis elegans]CAI79163.1 ORF3 [Caenorhabditis elegans]|eukprot:NP_001021229.1 Uncharacterized protein CELE_C54C6.7 [Caenorhabditis elegans]
MVRLLHRIRAFLRRCIGSNESEGSTFNYPSVRQNRAEATYYVQTPTVSRSSSPDSTASRSISISIRSSVSMTPSQEELEKMRKEWGPPRVRGVSVDQWSLSSGDSGYDSSIN